MKIKHKEWICIAVILLTTAMDALRDVLWMHPTIHPGYPYDLWHWVKWAQFYPALIILWLYIGPKWLKDWTGWIRGILIAGVCQVLWKVAATWGRSLY